MQEVGTVQGAEYVKGQRGDSYLDDIFGRTQNQLTTWFYTSKILKTWAHTTLTLDSLTHTHSYTQLSRTHCGLQSVNTLHDHSNAAKCHSTSGAHFYPPGTCTTNPTKCQKNIQIKYLTPPGQRNTLVSFLAVVKRSGLWENWFVRPPLWPTWGRRDGCDGANTWSQIKYPHNNTNYHPLNYGNSKSMWNTDIIAV